MATTGALLPSLGTAVSESPWSDDSWNGATNIYTSNGVYASVTAATFDSGDQTTVLKATGFDFSAIPDGSTIDGVIVTVGNAYYANGSGSIDLVQLLDVSRAKVGTNKASTPTALTTSTANYSFGSSTDLWGNALTAAWVKDADFGVAIGCLSTAANTDVFIDYVRVEVYYTPPAAANITGAGQVATAEAIGSASIAADVSSAGVTTGEVSGSPSLSVNIAAAGVASAEAVGQPTVGTPVQVIEAAGVPTAEAVGQPSIEAAVSAAGVVAAEAVGSPALAAAVVSTGVSTAESLGAPSVAASIAGAGVASVAAAGSPAIAAQVAVAGVASAETVGQPAVGAAAATIEAAGVASAEAIGNPALVALIAAAGATPASAVGQPAAGAVVAAAGVVSSEAFGQPAVGGAASATIEAAGIESAEALGAPSVGARLVMQGVSSGEAVGSPQVGDIAPAEAAFWSLFAFWMGGAAAPVLAQPSDREVVRLTSAIVVELNLPSTIN